ncbi:hypothetical protein AGR1B_Lc10046 [Agrobacterium fabacearum S56]|nr:hypothetical protein AGR1B_Lc10046 [Agrobacterium fabacearum S56]
MTGRLGYTQAKPTSPPTLRLKFVDKLFADKGFAFNCYDDAQTRTTAHRHILWQANRLPALPIT